MLEIVRQSNRRKEKKCSGRLITDFYILIDTRPRNLGTI
jgi:hypothetical protein